MAGWYLSEQARHALRTARALAREHQHTALGPPHLLAAILQQWDDEHAGGPALLRACGLTHQEATNLTARLVHAYDNPKPPTAAAEPRPNPAMRFMLAQAFRIAAEARPLRGHRAPGPRRGLARLRWRATSAGHQLPAGRRAARHPAHTEQAVQDAAIEPLEAVAVPTPTAVSLAELAASRPSTTQSKATGA
jgi:hypothetical protein